MNGSAPSLPLDFYPTLPLGLRWGLRFIWQAQDDGHQQDSAPGETFRTSWGVTPPIWDAAASHVIVSGALADATQDQCAAVYLAEFWNAMLLDDLPVPVAFCLFCDGTLTGSGHVARLLQRIVGAPQDGVIGRLQTVPDAKAFVGSRGAMALVDALITADEQYEAALANAPKFINGWTRREQEEQAWAHQIA